MKKIWKILLILIIALTITGCGKEEQTDALKFKEEYESLNNTIREKDGKKIREVSIPIDNPFVYTTAEEISEKIDNKETFVVYFGFSDCPWCRSIIEELISAAKESKIKTIYYVDVKDIRDIKEINESGDIETTKEGSKGYLELLDKLDNVLEDYSLIKDEETISTGEKRIFAPNIVAVSNGKAVELESGNSENQTDPYQELTDNMKKETKNKFKCLFKCLEEESTTCTKNAC